MAGIFDFLGVNGVSVASGVVMNASGQPRFKALNHLLAQNNPVKKALKRVIPYRTGMAVAQRMQNWNLRAREISPEDERAMGQRFESDVINLSGLLGRDLDPWLASAR